MLYLRSLAVCLLAWSFLFAFPTAAQVPQNEGEVNLSANVTYTVMAPAITASTLIPFQVDVEGRDADGFDVTVGNAGAVVSLILPGGTEITSLNAASLGFSFDVIEADSDEVTSGLFTSFFSLSGTHTVIRLPSTTPSGTYQIKVNTASLLTATPVYASYLSGSPIRTALSPDAKTYHVGDTVVLSAFLFNGTTPITNATIEAAVADQDHPEMPPVQVSLQDSGPKDAASGDGIYTGVYTAATAGKFLAAIRTTGTAPSGSAYTRTASTDFRVLPPLATFTSFSDVGVDDNGNGLFDRLAITATTAVQSGGNYRLELSLVASNGREAKASTTANLLAGAQQTTVSFSATQITGLGVDGPYSIKNATLLYTDDPEEPVAAFFENAGSTFAYALSSMEGSALKFTGNNTAVGVDTNANGKFDILRIQVEVIALTAGSYGWSGSLRDTEGKEIETIDGETSLTSGSNVINFDYNGSAVGRHGKDGPYTLRSVLVFGDGVSVTAEELFRTQAFSVTDFECSSIATPTIQPLTLASTIVGGNATVLGVSLAETAGACGALITISSDNPAVVPESMPAAVVIPPGEAVAEVTIVTLGVASVTPVVITATSGGASQSVNLTVLPSSIEEVVTVSPQAEAGSTATGIVRLDGAAPAGGILISLSSDTPSVATVPNSTAVLAGARTANFDINTNPEFQGNATVTISASFGGVTKNASLDIYAEANISGSITAGGEEVTLTAAEPGQNFLLAFSGNQGQRISLKITDITIETGANVSIKNPDGTILVAPVTVEGYLGFIDVTTLPTTGTYTILVDPQAVGTGSMTLTLYDVPPDVTGTIEIDGPPVTVATTVPGQNAQLSFDITAPHRIALQINCSPGPITGFNDIDVSIMNSDGDILATRGFGCFGEQFFEPVDFPSTGTYRILIDPLVISTGTLTFALNEVAADMTGSIDIGGLPVTVTTTTPGQNAVLTFSGTGGQRVSLQVSGSTFAGCPAVYEIIKNPNGNDLGSSYNCGDGTLGTTDYIDSLVLPVSGTYTILIDPQRATIGSQTLVLNEVADVTGNIGIDDPAVTVTTTTAGQNAILTFSGTAGQQVSLLISGSTFAGCPAVFEIIKDSNGNELASSYNCGDGTFGATDYIESVLLPVSGNYTILIDPQGETIGSQTLLLSELAADVTGTITPGGAAVTVTTTMAGQNASLTFSGSAGQRVSLQISGSTFTGCAAVYDKIKTPDGTDLATTYLCGATDYIDAVLLPVTGTFTISIDPQGTTTGTQTLQLNDVSDVTGTITPGGAAVTVTTTVAGQNGSLTFSGTAGQRVSLQISDSTLTDCDVYDTIKKPNGTYLASTSICGDTGSIDLVLLPVTGTYTISIDPQGTTIGSQTLALNEVPPDVTGTITPGGAAVTVTTTTAGQNARLTFSGAAGQRVSLQISNSTFAGCLAAYDSIMNPDGTVLATTYICNSTAYIDTVVLPVTGTYTVLIDPQGTNTGSQTLLLNDVPADVTGTITPGGAAVTVTTTTAGQNARLTFSGAAGQRVSLQISDSTFAGCIAAYDSINDPVGTNLASTYICNSTAYIDTVVLPVTGTYTVMIDPQGTIIGSQTVLLNDVPADTTGTITPGGAAVTVTTTSAGQNAILTFSGAAGQRVSLQISDSTFAGCLAAYDAIKNSDGTTLASTYLCSATGSIGTVVLPVTGGYTVLIDPLGTNTGSQTLLLNDVP
jgi:hypothetical protein